MAKASPMVRAFNAGEFSELLAGRVDLDRYNSSVRLMLNYVAAPQGPAIGRSGTAFVHRAFSQSEEAVLVPFSASYDDSRILEFTDGRIRFFLENGIQVYQAKAATVVSGAGDFITATVTDLDANVGDEVVLNGFPVSINLNGEIARVTAVVGDDYTLSVQYPAGATVADGTFARVYHIACDFTEDERKALRFEHSVDVIYIFTGGRPRKLSRYGDYDWRLEYMKISDGPYLPINDTQTTLTPTGTGNVVEVLSADYVNNVACSITSTDGEAILFNATGLDAEIGDWVTFNGFGEFMSTDVAVPAYPGSTAPFTTRSLNGIVAKITGKPSSTSYETDFVHPPAETFDFNGQVALTKAASLGFRPEIDGSKSSPVEFIGRDIEYKLEQANPYRAFDANEATSWASNAQQSGELVYVHPTPFVADGYTLYVAKDNQDASYGSTDFAPSSFTFEGYNGTSWVVLDRKENFVLYEGNKSAFIEIPNTTAYKAYRIKVDKLYRNGPIEPRLRRVVIREKDEVSFTLNASATVGINNDTGFQAGDVGRLIRLKGEDGSWRACEITAVNSTTSVDVNLIGEPLLSAEPTREWRLGYWSNTTGWPTCGIFFEDRFWLSGAREYPDVVVGSVSSDYENYAQANFQNEVLDDSAVIVPLNSRKLSRVEWMASDERGLIIGTGSEEFVLASPNNEALTARNRKARRVGSRGSASVDPVAVDNQILFVQRGGRNLREMAYMFERDGYKAPSMLQLASHIVRIPIKQIEYAQEPYSIVWAVRDDGKLVGLTYNRDENVIGWHQHDISGAVVESIAVIPQSGSLQDALWMTVVREIDGQNVRYIERLTRFWDFDMTFNDAFFLDSGLVYDGDPVEVVYGLKHLEGETVYGLADGKPTGAMVVENGSVELPAEASKVVIGLGFDAEVRLQRFENGAADGTSQGKTKRINNVTVAVWDSYGGQIGLYNEEYGEYKMEPIEMPGPFDEHEEPFLYTGVVGPITPTEGYDQNGYIAFKREAGTPLPLNIVAIMPQLNTQDR